MQVHKPGSVLPLSFIWDNRHRLPLSIYPPTPASSRVALVYMIFQRLWFTRTRYYYQVNFHLRRFATNVIFCGTFLPRFHEETAVSCQTALCCPDFPPFFKGDRETCGANLRFTNYELRFWRVINLHIAPILSSKNFPDERY